MFPVKNTNKLMTKLVPIVVSLIIGFIGGVVVSAYRTPSLVAQIPANQQAGVSKEEAARHIRHLEESVQKDSKDVDSWTKLAHAYFEMGAFDKAINAYTKILEIKPDDSDAYTDLGVMYRRNKQPEKAINSFKKAIELDQNNVHAQFNVGIVLFHDLGNKEEAIKAWEKVAALQPNYTLSTGQTIQQLVDSVKQ
ncbi:tetratricopeptide repeat protein [Desulforhopalus sp. IMCC35007]|nr:tetratricopeptide repeat protein [Desulforhopalus sp. IMCC35007]